MDIREKLEKKMMLSEAEKKQVCNELLTEEKNMESLILSCFDEVDYLNVYEHRIGRGVIGGKACGMLAARRLIEKNLPELANILLPHDSYYVGTQVFAEFLEKNGCMELWRNKDRSAGETKELEQRIKGGEFPEETERQMREMLRFYGDLPVVVRSSSLLEDGYGNAFSGKYESVFCMEQRSEERRLGELKDAVRRVYASMLRPSAIEYRRKWGLTNVEEKMSLLIQRAEGHAWGRYYFPPAAGMGCSYNSYKWMEALNPHAGMLRLVVGLGTKAVQRSQEDYPRMVGLERPEASLYTTVAERHRFSQRSVDVLDTESKELVTLPLKDIIPFIPEAYRKIILSRDDEAEQRLAQRREFRKVYFADCAGVVANRRLMSLMAEALRMLEREYGRPVDIEYALEFGENGDPKINLFQCRPIQKSKNAGITMRAISQERMLFDVGRATVRKSKEEKIDVIVWINPQKYYECRHAYKANVAYAVGCINRHYEKEGTGLMLLAPGRIGTSSPELGVPVDYSDISNFRVICEVEYSKAGYAPELSYGSHMFQDLVEADVYYGAIEEGGATKVYRPEMLKSYPEIFLKLFPDFYDMGGIVKVYDVSGVGMRLLTDAEKGRVVCAVEEERK